MQVFKLRKSLEAITKLKKTKAEKAKLTEEKLREVIKIYKEVTEKIRNMVDNEEQLTTFNAEGILDALQHLTEYLYSKYESYTKIEREAIKVAESVWSFDKWRKEGKKEGKIEGIKEGKIEGIKEGKIEGIKEGERKKEIELTENLIKIDLPVEKIIQVTGLSEKEVMKIKMRLNI